MSETKITDWVMLAVTSAHLIVAWLEFRRNKTIDELKKDLNKQLKLIKKLEEKQQNYKDEGRSELKNLAKKFEEMHTSIFKVATFPNFLYNKIGHRMTRVRSWKVKRKRGIWLQWKFFWKNEKDN